jgi:L-aspartate oxidase
MTNYVGIVRSRKRLDRARKRMKILYDEIEKYYWEYNLTGDLIELRNLMTVARLIIESAIKRRESRGLHYIVDYPNKSWRKKNTIMKRKFKK